MMFENFKYLAPGVIKRNGCYRQVSRCIEEGIVYYYHYGEWTSEKPKGFLYEIPEEDRDSPDSEEIAAENEMLAATSWNWD